MEKVYLIGGLRSHIGLTGGLFKTVPAEELAAAVLQKIMAKYPFVLQADGLLCGNAVGTGGNITRLAALKAGLPATVPALTIDMQCASAAASIELAMTKIGSGMADILIAGGFESTSMQAERTCQKHGFSREELDAFAVRSHQLAKKAREENRLNEIVVSVFGSEGDEGIRDRMSPKLAARMPKLFTEEEVKELLAGDSASLPIKENVDKQNVLQEQKIPVTPLLTAANACLMNDGAAFVVLASRQAVEQYGLRPEAELLAGFDWGVDPRYSPEGAIETGAHLLQRCDLQPEQIDVFEYNEAFAVISALFARKYPELTARYCPWGGALAYGHPYGASGAILLLHLWQELKQTEGKLGLLSIAGAGGLGTALLVKKA